MFIVDTYEVNVVIGKIATREGLLAADLTELMITATLAPMARLSLRLLLFCETTALKTRRRDGIIAK